MIQVDIVVRSDAPTKFGGDVEQVRQYERHLGDRADIRVIPFHPAMELREDAIVHYVNVDRPFDFLKTIELAGDRRTVVSPIHHSLRRVRQMRMAERGRGIRSVVDRAAPEEIREWLASGVRAVRASRTSSERFRAVRTMTSSLLLIPHLWRRVGEALGRSSAVALLAPGERDDLVADTGWSALNAHLVPNGRPELASSIDAPEWARRPIDIVSVGRIEPRKRSLELARTAVALGIKVVFVGTLESDGSSYAREFRLLADESPLVDYRGALTHEQVLDLVSRSKTLINASWVEVQSLVDLEAAHLGTWVVSSPNGNSRDWLSEHVAYAQDFDLDSLLELAAELSSASAGPGVAPSYAWDWRRSADALWSLYTGSEPQQDVAAVPNRPGEA